MNKTELKGKVYTGVIMLAISLVREGKTMTTDELTAWINKNFPGFEHPYGNARGVPQAAFRRAKEANNQEGICRQPTLRLTLHNLVDIVLRFTVSD